MKRWKAAKLPLIAPVYTAPFNHLSFCVFVRLALPEIISDSLNRDRVSAAKKMHDQADGSRQIENEKRPLKPIVNTP